MVSFRPEPKPDKLVTSRVEALLIKANAFNRAMVMLSKRSLWTQTVIDVQKSNIHASESKKIALVI